jgi:hypothetical protein
VKVIQKTFAATSFEQAWNTAIDGIFGPTGVPGVILNLTIGAGQQIAVIPPGQGPNQDAPFSNFIPSTRTLLQSAANQIAGIGPTGLATPNPLVTASGASVKKAARSAASARSAAAVAAPAVAAPAGDSSAAADSSAPAEKPAAHRASRKAVRAAS